MYLAEAEARGQTKALHLGQGLAVHSIAVNLTRILDLKVGEKKFENFFTNVSLLGMFSNNGGYYLNPEQG